MLSMRGLSAVPGYWFRLGREPAVLPEPLDTLVLQLVATRRGHAAIGDQGTSAWLFRGGQPDGPSALSA